MSEPELFDKTLERTDHWRVKYVWSGSDKAWFEFVGPWSELATMMAEKLPDVQSMEIKHLGRTCRAVRGVA